MVPSLAMGGMERVCVNYANLLYERGYHVTLMNLTTDAEMIIEKLNKNIIYHKNIAQRVPTFFRTSLLNIIKGRFRLCNIEKWLKSINPERLYKLLITDNPNQFDIEIAFYGGHMMRVISGSNQKNSIKIGWIHSPAIEKHFHFFKSFISARDTYLKMDILMCVSEEVKEKAEKLFGKEVNAKVLYNPNNTKLIRELSKKRITDVSYNRFTFINASRLEFEIKGYDLLIDSCKRLKDNGYEFDLWIIGDGEGKSSILQLIEEYQLQDTVHYLGPKDNPYCYLSKADCYICSSRSEGFSMVVAESVIIGTPVVSTDVSGAREMLGDSEYGLIVKNSGEGIYLGMKKVLSDTKYWEHLKEQAQKRKDFLNEENIMNSFEGIIQEEIRGREHAQIKHHHACV